MPVVFPGYSGDLVEKKERREAIMKHYVFQDNNDHNADLYQNVIWQLEWYNKVELQ